MPSSTVFRVCTSTPGAPAPRIVGTAFRSPDALPVRFAGDLQLGRGSRVAAQRLAARKPSASAAAAST